MGGYGGDWGGGIGYGSFSATSASAQRHQDEARAKISACIAAHPPHATAEGVHEAIVGPKTHVVDNLWGPLCREFKAQHVALKRRKITDEERKAAKIATQRPRYVISVHILPLSKRPKPSGGGGGGSGGGSGGGGAQGQGQAAAAAAAAAAPVRREAAPGAAAPSPPPKGGAGDPRSSGKKRARE